MLHVPVRPKEASISAVIIRADGTHEVLGTISYWHRNPFRRLWWWLRNRTQTSPSSAQEKN